MGNFSSLEEDKISKGSGWGADGEALAGRFLISQNLKAKKKERLPREIRVTIHKRVPGF